MTSEGRKWEKVASENAYVLMTTAMRMCADYFLKVILSFSLEHENLLCLWDHLWARIRKATILKLEQALTLGESIHSFIHVLSHSLVL